MPELAEPCESAKFAGDYRRGRQSSGRLENIGIPLLCLMWVLPLHIQHNRRLLITNKNSWEMPLFQAKNCLKNVKRGI